MARESMSANGREALAGVVLCGGLSNDFGNPTQASAEGIVRGAVKPCLDMPRKAGFYVESSLTNGESSDGLVSGNVCHGISIIRGWDNGGTEEWEAMAEDRQNGLSNVQVYPQRGGFGRSAAALAAASPTLLFRPW